MKIEQDDIWKTLHLFYGTPKCPINDNILAQTLVCVFLKRKDMPQRCQESCVWAQFRLVWESNSPAYFGEFLRVSRSNQIFHNYLGTISEWITPDPKQLQPAFDELSKLEIFKDAVFMALYPLFLANDENFPFFSSEEIRQEREIFLKEGADAITAEMKSLNASWHRQVSDLTVRLSSEYASEIFFLVQIFFRDEKRLFKKIEELLAHQRDG